MTRPADRSLPEAAFGLRSAAHSGSISVQKETTMLHPHLNLRYRWRWAAVPVVLAAAATLAATSACQAPAGAVTASGTTTAPTESSLVHQLMTCLPAGQARPTVVLVH